MENSEIKPLVTGRKTENYLAGPSQKEQNPAVQNIRNFKKDIDLKIGSESAKVEGIFGFFRRHNSKENKDIKVPEKPEEILEEIGNDLTKLSEIRMIRKPTIDDIANNLAAPALKAQEIAEWLSVNKNKIQSESLNKDMLEKKREEILRQLEERRQKSILQRVKSLGKKRLLDSELKQVNKQILSETKAINADNISRQKIEPAFKHPKELIEKYTVDAAGQFFEDVVEQQRQLRDKLNSPEIKEELNKDLIALRIQPKLDELVAGGKMTNEEAKEYVDLLKNRLVKGSQPNRNGISEEEKKAIEVRERRLNMLNYKSEGEIPDISLIRGDKVTADAYYDTIFDVLLRQSTNEIIERLRNSFSYRLDEKLQGSLMINVENVVDDPRNWGAKYLKGKSLDLKKVNIDYFKDLDGLERWPIVKKFAESTGIIPIEVFENTEKNIIQRLFDEQLFPGGYESDAGTVAARKMADLGNPYALPLMIKHIQSYEAGNTSIVVLGDIARLFKECDPEKLNDLSENQRLIVQAITDKNSYLRRFVKDQYEICQMIKKYGNGILKHEKYAKVLESNGTSEDGLRNFYLMTKYDEITKEYDITKLLEQIKKVAEITGDNKKTIINDYFDDLTSHIFFTRKETPNTIKQLSQELEISAKEIYDRVKDKLNSENLSNYPEELWNPLDSIKMLKELAGVIGVDKKDLIGQYFGRITFTISLQKKYSASTIKQLSIELDQPAKQIYEKIEGNILKSNEYINREGQLKAIGIVKEIATVINIDKKILIEKYFTQLSQGLSIDNKYSADIIKQLALDLDQPASKIYDRVKNNFTSKSKDPLQTLELFKQIATVINVDKKDLIRQHLDQLTANIDYQLPKTVDVILKISEEIVDNSGKTAQDIAKEIAKKDFISSLKSLDLKRSEEIKERFDFFISSQELIDISPAVQRLVFEFKNISPEFYEQALKSPNIVLSLFGVKDSERAIETVKSNSFLVKAVSENPRFGSKLLVKYPDFDEISKEEIKSIYDWKKEILESNPQIDPQSIEFRELMQEKLKSFKRNQEILGKMKERGIDTDKWLNYDKIEPFTLSSAESKASFSEVIATPINRIKETISDYTDQIKKSLKDYEPELKEYKIFETGAVEIVELMRKMEKELQRAQNSGNDEKVEGIKMGIAQYKEKMKKIKEISLWDKVNGDINSFDRIKNSVSKSHEDLIKAEEKFKELSEKKERQPKEMEEAKRNINISKEELKEKFKQLEKRMSDFSTNLPEVLEPIGNEKSEALRRNMQEGLAEQFGHYDSDISDLNNLFSQETGKEKERLEGRSMTIRIWSRNPDIDLYQGNYSPCCISVETGTHEQPQKSTIADYETDLGIQVVLILDEYTKEPVTAAWCWTGEDGEMKTALVADNIESNTKYSNYFSDQMTDKLLNYIKEYSDAIKTGKAVMGGKNNDLPTKNRLDKMTNDSQSYAKIGGYNRTEEGYYLEAENNEVKII